MEEIKLFLISSNALLAAYVSLNSFKSCFNDADKLMPLASLSQRFVHKAK